MEKERETLKENIDKVKVPGVMGFIYENFIEVIVTLYCIYRYRTGGLHQGLDIRKYLAVIIFLSICSMFANNLGYSRTRFMYIVSVFSILMLISSKMEGS